MMRPKVFGIGAHRTGTATLAAALNKLGFKVIHMPLSIIEPIEQGQFMFTELETADGFSDFPTPVIFRELDQHYPKSKFILTFRDTELWLRSVDNHIRNDLYNLNRAVNDAGQYSFSPLERLFYKEEYFEPDTARACYESHNQNVHNYFRDRSADLLSIDFSQGNNWQQLCSFLDIDVPDEEFPHLNRRF